MDMLLDIFVQNVMVMIICMWDLVLVDFKCIDLQGQFCFELLIDIFQLIVRYLSYKDFNFYFFGLNENWEFDFNLLVMLDKSILIGEFVVYVNKNLIYYNGDIFVYVVDFFKVKEGVVVEDFFK